MSHKNRTSMGKTPSEKTKSLSLHVSLAFCCLGAILAGVCFAVFHFRKENDPSDRNPAETSKAVSDSEPVVSTADKSNSSSIGEIVTRASVARRKQLIDLVDPSQDGWESEIIAEQISFRFRQLGNLLKSGSIEKKDLERLIDERFVFRPLDQKRENVFSDDRLSVIRGDFESSASDSGADSQFDGSNAIQARLLAGALHDRFARRFSNLSNVRIKFKVFKVDRTDQAINVEALYEATGTKKNKGSVQQSALWNSQWSIGKSNQPKLLSVSIEEFEEVETTSDGPTLFVDCTEGVLGDNASFRHQLMHGTNFWMQRLPGYLSPRLLEGHIGIAVGDVNQDGLDDLYVCQPGGLPNRLYLQNRDGTATDVSADAGVDVLDWSYSSLIVDLNNDGKQDLAVLADTQLLLFAGDGSGRFALRETLASTCEYSLTAADYDNDGDLDLYACNYFAASSGGLAQLDRTDPLHNSNTGGRNILWRNDGEWSFFDATQETGLDASNRRWSLAAAWEDYDNDGDMDLYVVNDFGHNNLYRNDGKRFTEVSESTGTIDANQGMSISWADYDHDGWMDMYISNMFSAAGNRVTFQPNFMANLSESEKGLYQQLARGNSLLRNQGNGKFLDVSSASRVTMGRWAWASLFFDMNNDGLEDLFVTNGYLTQDSADDL